MRPARRAGESHDAGPQAGPEAAARPSSRRPGGPRPSARGRRGRRRARRATARSWPGSASRSSGPSGSGKSTLLHLLAGLDAPTAGTVSWPGPAVARAAARARSASSSRARACCRALDVIENVALPAAARRRAEDASARRRARRALDRLGIGDAGRQAARGAVRRPGAAGRGRAGARRRPRLILADEPTGQLDHATAQRGRRRAAAGAPTSSGAALVVATHDPAVAGRLPHRWAMHDGRLVHPGADRHASGARDLAVAAGLLRRRRARLLAAAAGVAVARRAARLARRVPGRVHRPP